MALTALTCRNHPERPGLGRCTSCQGTFCEECSTRVEGILRCRDCLPKDVLKAAGPKARWRSLQAVAPALLLGPLAYLAVAWLLYGVAASLALLQTWRLKP